MKIPYKLSLDILLLNLAMIYYPNKVVIKRGENKSSNLIFIKVPSNPNKPSICYNKNIGSVIYNNADMAAVFSVIEERPKNIKDLVVKLLTS